MPVCCLVTLLPGQCLLSALMVGLGSVKAPAALRPPAVEIEVLHRKIIGALRDQDAPHGFGALTRGTLLDTTRLSAAQ